jgi:hypothetical protein
MSSIHGTRRFKTGHASAIEKRPLDGGYWVEESSSSDLGDVRLPRPRRPDDEHVTVLIEKLTGGQLEDLPCTAATY